MVSLASLGRTQHMRVVAGKYRGKRLDPPSRIKARPTTDFAKEGLFNILQHSIELNGVSVLDLFAGSGGISMEFISRGAGSLVSVDTDRQAIDFMQRLAREMQLDNWHIINADVFSFLSTYAHKLDIIFADPPFRFGKHEKLVRKVMANDFLKKGGMFILEHPKDVDLSDEPGYLKTRNYGNLKFSFFRA